MAGGLVIAASVLVAIGWWGNVPALTAWLPTGSFMVMNAAGCVFAAGLALWALSFRLWAPAAVLGIAIFGFGAAALLARWFGWFAGINELLWVPQWAAPAIPPGQMAPNAAAAFLFVGTALVLVSARVRSRWFLPLLGGMTIALALLPLLAMAVEWGMSGGALVYRGMALPTALCLLVLVVALLHVSVEHTGEAVARSFLAAGVGMLVSVGVITVEAESELVEANSSVAHSHEVRSNLDHFVAEVARMESTVRAYALTADRFFAERFDTHEQALLADLASVRRVVADNSVQRARGARLQQLAQSKIDQAAEMLRAADAGGPANAARYLRSLSRADTSALVQLIDEMQAEEDRLLSDRAAAQRLAEHNTRVVQLVGALIAFGLLSVALASARRAARARLVAESSLRRSEEQLRLLVENVRDYAFYLLDPRGVVTTWNAGAVRLKGYSPEEAIGGSFARFYPPEDQAAGVPARHLAEALATGRYAGEGWRLRQDGARFLASDVILPLRNERGELLGFAKTTYDITERTRAEAALRESEERFRHAFEDAGIGMGLVGLDGRWLRVNRALCAIVGYPADELLKLTFEDITHPEDVARDYELARALVERHELFYRTEKRYVHRDGHIVWINVTVSLMRDSAGAPVHFISQIEDITARRQLETDLRRARDDALAAQADLAAVNRLHRAVLDGNEFAIVATRPDGLITVFSGGAEKMLGYSAGEMVGQATPLHLHLPGEMRARAAELSVQLGMKIEPAEAMRTLAERGRTDEHEWTYVRKDGSHVPVRLSMTALRDEAGVITGYLGIAQDLTQRKKTEFALQASEERLRHVLARADCLVWEAQVRIDGEDWDWRFLVQPSAMYRRLFGTDRPEEKVGLWYNFEIPEMTELDRRSREAILARRAGYEQEFRLVQGDRVTWIHESVSIQSGEPGCASLVGVATDITERKRLEASLAHARDDALGASRLKSEFLATMSHEFRTPMNGVLGMVDLLARTELDPDQREMVRVARASTESLLVLIEDVLDFSRLEAAKLRIAPVDFSLLGVLEETLGLLAPRAGEKAIELVGDFAPTLAGTFHGDTARIRQIVTNLAGNAVKFTERGEVVVSAAFVRDAGRESVVRIAVRDTGIGIPAEAHGRLFRAFTQVDSSSTRRYGGTGLGLAISSQLVALMGGEIGFTSEPGRGSEFWFSLPLPRVAPAPAPRTPAVGRQLLVVDPCASARLVLLAQLQRTGALAEGVADAPAARAWLQACRSAGADCDAVFIAARLPEASGDELAEALRADPARPAPLLILLAQPGARLEPSARWAAALTKPVFASALCDALERLWRPVRPVPVRREMPPPLTAQSGRRVLVVEDNLSNQIVARLLLENFGCTVEVASSGLAALQRLALPPPVDLILLDCQMPELDGYETARRIRAGAVPGASVRVPIIALTAYAMPEDREKCLAAGMDDFLTKPIHADTLRAMLDRHLSSAATTGLRADDIFDRSAMEVLQGLPGRGQPSLWVEMTGLFRAQEADWLAEIDSLIAARAATELASVSHRLAGACASIAAHQMQLAALAVERAARAGDWSAVAAAQTDLHATRARLLAALDALPGEHA